jgi:hypothetical protein
VRYLLFVLFVWTTSGCYMGLVTRDTSLEARPFEHTRTTRIVWSDL